MGRPALKWCTTPAYTYSPIAYTNPDGVTQIANGSATTSYAYDNNGNVTQAGIWTYLYDYLNRITSIGGGGSTSTFGYDTFGSRVYQAATTSTTTYATKFYSVSSTTIAGASWATTTSYIWLGGTLLGTIDQQFKAGTATGTAQARYIHVDHLGSTDVVTDGGDNLVQTMGYYPFGATRIFSATSTNEQRKYLEQFSDDNTGLNYLQNRYYNASQGQFISEDPVFWEIGLTRDGKQSLLNPQSINTYAYANDNPITNKDPNGRLVELISRTADPTVVGSHTFVAVYPDNPNTIGTIPNVDTSRPFALGGYPSPGYRSLIKGTTDATDNAYLTGQRSTSAIVIVAPPPGMTSAEFDASIVASYNALPDTFGAYNFLGQPQIFGASNSNNVATSILRGAGVSFSQISSYKTQLFQNNLQWSAGFGIPAGTPSYAARLGSVLSSLQSTLSKLLTVLKSK
jgi:RHS repeat-associated protein